MGWELIGGFALLIVVIAVLAQRRRRRKRLLGEVAQLPARVVNPRLHASLRSIRAWELEVVSPAQACTWARESSGKRFRAEVAVPLPIAGCGKTCQCRYLPVTENRRRQRRFDPTAVNEIPYQPVQDQRRPKRGRRKEDNWSGGSK